MANPLNAQVCIGQGLSVDGLGRPQWTKAVAGQWASAPVFGQGFYGGPNFGLNNLIAPIANSSARDRAAIVTFWCQFVDILSYPSSALPGADAGPSVLWRWGIGPGLAAGNADLTEVVMDGFPSVPVRIRFPGPNPTNLVTVPAGQTYNAALTVSTKGSRNTSVWDVLLGSLTITAHWLGG